MVAPGAEVSVAPNEPSRFRSKKTVPWAVWDATWKSRVIIQSGTPSPFASAGARFALAILTGRGTDARGRATDRGVRDNLPIDAVCRPFPQGADALEGPCAAGSVTSCSATCA